MILLLRSVCLLMLLPFASLLPILPYHKYIYIYVSKSQWLVGKTWSKGSPGSPPLLGEECNKHQKAFGIAPSFRISHLRFSKLTSIANKQIIFQTLPDPHVWSSVSMTQGQPGSNSHNSPPPGACTCDLPWGLPPKLKEFWAQMLGDTHRGSTPSQVGDTQNSFAGRIFTNNHCRVNLEPCLFFLGGELHGLDLPLSQLGHFPLGFSVGIPWDRALVSTAVQFPAAIGSKNHPKLCKHGQSYGLSLVNSYLQTCLDTFNMF